MSKMIVLMCSLMAGSVTGATASAEATNKAVVGQNLTADAITAKSLQNNEKLAGAKSSPASAEVASVPLQLVDLPEVGRGRFDYLFWHIYDARLQTVDGKFVDYQQSAPVLLSLTYQRDISKNDFIDATLDQWLYQQRELQPRHREWAALLSGIWRDVKVGDTLSCQRDATGEVQFFLNRVYLGSIQDVSFADEFLDIWLGSRTSEPTLRKQLLSAASVQKE